MLNAAIACRSSAERFAVERDFHSEIPQSQQFSLFFMEKVSSLVIKCPSSRKLDTYSVEEHTLRAFVGFLAVPKLITFTLF